MNATISNANIVIDALGGTAQVAALCRVTPPAVSQWRQKGIPECRLQFLRLVRPDVFAQIEAGVPHVCADADHAEQRGGAT